MKKKVQETRQCKKYQKVYKTRQKYTKVDEKAYQLSHTNPITTKTRTKGKRYASIEAVSNVCT